jgi:uncharacterized membrane protein
MLFRRRGNDRLVATLEAGSVTFLALFIALEIRHWSGDGNLEHPVSFTEAALHLLTLSMQATAYLYLAQRGATAADAALDNPALGDPALANPALGDVAMGWAWQILGGIALVCGIALLAGNPMVISAPVGTPVGVPVGALALFAAYLGPACLAALACRFLPTPNHRIIVGAYAVVAGFAWITLQIRQLFHPDAMALQSAPVKAAELWGWSGAWLAYGIALMARGIRTGHRPLRRTALGVIAIVCAKVFIIDMSGLTGLWRVLSFLGLGLALIGLGVVYRRFVLPARPGKAP